MLVLLAVACSKGPPEPTSGHAPEVPAAPPPAAVGEGEHGDHATITHRFDDAAKWSVRFDDPARDAWQKPVELVAALKIPTGAVVADLGAGTGYFEPHLAKAVGPTGRVVAEDVEPSMVDWLRARVEREGLAQVEPRLGTPADPALKPAEVDLVLLVDTYHHVDGRIAWFQRLAPTLKPGGRLVIVDFDPASQDTNGPPSDHRIAPEKVIDELGAAGWSLLERPALLPSQYVLVFEPKP